MGKLIVLVYNEFNYKLYKIIKMKSLSIMLFIGAITLDEFATMSVSKHHHHHNEYAQL